MKFNPIFLAVLFQLILIFDSIGQLTYESYVWLTNPTIHEVLESDLDFPGVIVNNVKIVEHKVDMYANTAYTYSTSHKIVHINNDAGIEKFNKVYVPMSSGESLIDIKVRAISPSGKITLIQRENIKELENVRGISNVKIFAIEGLEVGGEAEYLYIVKSNFDPFGSEVLQSDVPCYSAMFELYFPYKWKFQTKSFNGLSVAREKYKGKNKFYQLREKNIPALTEEEYSGYRTNLMRLDYKLVDNGVKSNLFSWDYIAESIVRNLSASKGIKAGSSITKDIPATLENEEKIRFLENKIKSSIKLQRGGSEELSNPYSVYKSGQGNERGLLKLYIYALNNLKIPHELVFCANRFDRIIDEDYANPADITELIIYFPQYDKYLLPGGYHMRLGVPHTGLSGTLGVYVKYDFYPPKSFTLKNVRFDQLKTLDTELNKMGINAKIDLSENIDLPVINHENFSQGYRGFSMRAAYNSADDSWIDEFLNDMTVSSFENYEILDRSIEGEDINLSFSPEEFFSVKTQFTTPEFVEQAGDEYLLSVGKLIGKQSELYQETERKSDIKFHSISNYHHTINIVVPEGFELDGLEDIIIDNKVMLDDKKVMFFYSNYELVDNNLTITVDEVYSVLDLPVDKYEEFRKVVNSAANFNKLSLVLRPIASNN